MHKYEEVVNKVQEWIGSGMLKPGDRVLSVREMSAKLGFSTVTVHQAFGILESEGILEARPRSGFYVAASLRPLPEFDPSASAVEDHLRDPMEETAIGQLDAWGTWRGLQFDGMGSMHLSGDLLPHDDLYRRLATNIRWEGAHLEQPDQFGYRALRDIVERRLVGVAGRTNPMRISIVGSIKDAVGHCLDAIAPEGSRILVETPMDADSVAAVLGRRYELVEIYSHPRSGVDPDQFQHLLEEQQIAACLISPHKHSPTGVTYPIESARRIVEAATDRNVPIIEYVSDQNQLLADAPYRLADFDTSGIVVRVGGFSETLGPRFGLSWIAMPRGLAQLVPMPPQHAGSWALQKTLAEFLQRRSHERYMRRLNGALSARTRRGLSLIFQNLPDSCTVSRPRGGYMCWIRGPKGFDATRALVEHRSQGVEYVPGPLFSVAGAFPNFLALNLSIPWTAEQEKKLALLGRILSRPQ